jgi:hypothetical protein
MSQRDVSERLEQAAADLDPDLPAEEKAKRLRPELEAYAEDQELKEQDDDLDSAADAPERTLPGVAEHEREMARRGFEKSGPPG